MPLLDHCWFCSLRVAASVLALYITVAYTIAFLMEVWWIWDTGGQFPHLGYILTAGYLVTCILSAILMKGISEKKMPHLIVWMGGVLAISAPEAGIVLFMSIHFWKIHTIYGLTEITCWVCRLIVNMAGLVCVQSLYSLWKEEKQVLTSLRDLNKASSAVMENGRRLSLVPDKRMTPVIYSSGYSHVDHPPITTSLKRTASTLSLQMGRPVGQGPRPVIQGQRSVSPSRNEFNASLFNRNVLQPPRSQSMLNLNQIPEKKQEMPVKVATQSLDRKVMTPRLIRSQSMGFFPSGEDRMRNGYFDARLPQSGFLIDEYGRVVYVHDSPFMYPVMARPFRGAPLVNSKTSLAESDDLHKYRDVAL